MNERTVQANFVCGMLTASLITSLRLDPNGTVIAFRIPLIDGSQNDESETTNGDAIDETFFSKACRGIQYRYSVIFKIEGI